MIHPLLAIPTDTNTLMWGVAIFTLTYVVIRPMLKKKRDPLEQSSFPSLSQQRSVERQMSNLLVELSEMARQITAQLDTRSAKLEALIEEADRKLAALAKATGSLPGDNSPSEPPPSYMRLADAPQTPLPSAQPQPLEPPAQAPADSRHQQVYDLADQGLSAQEIARQLDRPQGEIELILALRV